MLQLAGRQLPLSLLVGLLQLLLLSQNSDPKFFIATRLQIEESTIRYTSLSRRPSKEPATLKQTH